jgi:ABC-type Zn uptake system ZnuABC Zn-binding protein ZnuA
MARLAQVWTLFLLLSVALAACSGGAAPDVLATTSILADVTRNVAGDRLTVGSLLPAGTDPHSYQPVPQDATLVDRSKVIVVHGAEYEEFLQPLLDTASGEETVIEAAKGVRFHAGTDGEQAMDPHVWLDPNNVIVYVDNIREV